MPLQATTSQGNDLRQAETDAGTNPLSDLTLAQALAWIDANVTDLPSARTALKHAAKLIFILKRRVDRLEAAVEHLER